MKPVAGLPYAHLNLRTNPFRSLEPAERADVAVVEVEGLARWLREGGHGRPDGPTAREHGPGPRRPGGGADGRRILQLVGAGGCGKTTWLEALHRRLPGASLVAWSAVHGWPPLPPDGPLLVDDAQELPARSRRVACRRGVLVLATRTDLTRRLRRLDGELRTLRVEDLVTPTRMVRMIARRMEWARRGPGAVPAFSRATLARLWARHGPDVRRTYEELYHRIPAHPSP